MVTQSQRSNHRIAPVGNLALKLWRRVVLYRLVQENQLSAHLIRLISDERSGQLSDAHILKKAIQSLIILGTVSSPNAQSNLSYYDKFFLDPFQQETHAFYVRESTDFLAHNTNTVMEYVHRATLRLAQEESRAKFYLHATSIDRHMATCCDAFLCTHITTCQDEFKRQLALNGDANLKALYDLFVRVPGGTERLKDDFCDHVQKEGRFAIAALGNGEGDVDPVAYVNALGLVHERFMKMVKEKFAGNKLFSVCVDKAGFLRLSLCRRVS